MLFSFKLGKPDNMQVTFENLKHKIANTGGKLTGNDQEGTISVAGIEGKYTVDTDTIKITITKKPSSLFPNKVIENRIRAIFRELQQLHF